MNLFLKSQFVKLILSKLIKHNTIHPITIIIAFIIISIHYYYHQLKISTIDNIDYSNRQPKIDSDREIITNDKHTSISTNIIITANGNYRQFNLYACKLTSSVITNGCKLLITISITNNDYQRL